MASSITHGVQFYSYLDLEGMMGGGMGGGFAALMAGGPEAFIKSTFHAIDDGQETRSKTGTRAAMSLATVQVKISRDEQGNSTFSFSHGSRHATATRNGDCEDMQLYLNCLGSADNNTYDRLDEITVDPALELAVEEAAKLATKESEQRHEENEEEEEDAAADSDDEEDLKDDNWKEETDTKRKRRNPAAMKYVQERPCSFHY